MKNEKDYLYNMNSYLELISFFILSLILAFTVQKIFITYRKFDDFNHRTSHNVLATKTGGISFFISLLIFTIFYYYKGSEIFDFSLMIPLSIMFIVGVYDDFYEADFKLKFLLQIIVSKIIIDQGYVIDSFQGIFGILLLFPLSLSIPTMSSGWALSWRVARMREGSQTVLRSQRARLVNRDCFQSATL